MSISELDQKSKHAPLEGAAASNSSVNIPSPGEMEKTLRLGKEVMGFIVDLTDMARMEATLAVKSLPRLLMLWFIMMPIILLAWCSFSVVVAWGVYSITSQTGAGLLTFFFQQLLLLFICRGLYVKCKKRMTMPYTREHLTKMMKGFAHESPDSVSDKKL